jgi:hypothetical protein
VPNGLTITVPTPHRHITASLGHKRALVSGAVGLPGKSFDLPSGSQLRSASSIGPQSSTQYMSTQGTLDHDRRASFPCSRR